MSERLGTKAVGARQWVLVALFVSAAAANGQPTFEVTPLVGGKFGGSMKLEQTGQPNRLTRLDDSLSYGVAAGFRFDGEDCERCDVVVFRWMRQNTHLNIENIRPPVTVDHFLGDFTHEFPLRETQDRVSPFVTASLGVAYLATPVESRTRFEFGFGAGIKVFPSRRWGFRIQVEYLPMVLNAEVQRVVCAGGCIIAINGGVMNQFLVSLGPTIRF